MNRNNQKDTRRNRRAGNTSNTTKYAKPILRKINNQATTVTVENAGIITYAGGMASGTATPFYWKDFNHFNQMAQDYKYFEFESFQIELVWDNPAGTDTLGVCAYYPVNYLVEIPVTTVPTQSKQIDGLSGAVTIQPGAPNRGRWAPTYIKQQFASTNSASAAGYLYTFLNNRSLSQAAVTVIIRCNLKFYGAVYNTVTALPAFEIESEAVDVESYEDIPARSTTKSSKSRR